MPASLLTQPTATPFSPFHAPLRHPRSLRRCSTKLLALNPWKTLEVDEGSTPKEIKRAYRKLALRHHPDVNGSEEHFLNIQQAYHTLIDSARGKEIGRHQQGGWNFHDWYWQFRQDRTWGGRKHKQQGQAASRSSGPTEGELAAQLAGLRQRARSRQPPAAAQPYHGAASASSMSKHNTATAPFPATDQAHSHSDIAASSPGKSAAQLSELQLGTDAARPDVLGRQAHSHSSHPRGRTPQIQSLDEIFSGEEDPEAADWAQQFFHGPPEAGGAAPKQGLDRLAACIRYHLTSAFGNSPLSNVGAAGSTSSSWLAASGSRSEDGHGGQWQSMQNSPPAESLVHAMSAHEQLHSHEAISNAHEIHRLGHRPAFPLEQEQLAFEDLQHSAMHADFRHGFKPQPVRASHDLSQPSNDHLWQQDHGKPSPVCSSSSYLPSHHLVRTAAQEGAPPALEQQPKPDAEPESDFTSPGGDDQIGSQLAGLRRRSALRKSR